MAHVDKLIALIYPYSPRSNNALSELPEAVFKLWSLRSLSAAQNKIEHLRLPSGGDPRQTLPVLEELYLQVGLARDVH